MNIKLAIVGFLFLHISCSKKVTYFNKHKLEGFAITTSSNWEYIKLNSNSSFVGRFCINSSRFLTFDYSKEGYSPVLIQTEEEFFQNYEHGITADTIFFEPSVYYTLQKDIEIIIKSLEVDLPMGDSSQILIREFPNVEADLIKNEGIYKKAYPNAEFLAIYKFENKRKIVPVTLPNDVKSHKVRVVSKYPEYKKIIVPQKGAKGMTGVYIRHKIEGFSFSFYGYDLTREEQKKALESFKTIEFE